MPGAALIQLQTKTPRTRNKRDGGSKVGRIWLRRGPKYVPYRLYKPLNRASRIRHLIAKHGDARAKQVPESGLSLNSQKCRYDRLGLDFPFDAAKPHPGLLRLGERVVTGFAS